MLKIKLPIPPYNEQMIKKFCDDIVEVKFDPLPDPISCIAIVNHGSDIENIANTIRTKTIFGKNIEVEIINDDESLYQEHIEADEDDESMALYNEFERNNIEPKHEGIDEETFVKLLQMRLRGPRPVVSNDDVIEILSDTTEEDLDNEEVLSKIDDEANTFIHGLLEIQNLYTTKSGDNEETSNASLMNDNAIDIPTRDTDADFERFVSGTKQNNDTLEKNLKRPSEVGGIPMQSLLNNLNQSETDSNKKMKSDRLNILLSQEDVTSKENNRTVSFNQNDINSYDSDLNYISTNPTGRLSEFNGTSEDGTT
ncbi:suppressor of Mek1-like [Chrysoperla carnea]|uniref:suppressor of Mek1-like n=1 Tax=Chrysoperla carnea TaxID=189513 RepID=UPI001D09353E|nr:suppressor of Mek1-like [Chrysoperla carnea]